MFNKHCLSLQTLFETIYHQYICITSSFLYVSWTYREIINGSPTFENILMTFLICYISKVLIWHWCREFNTNVQRGPLGYSQYPYRPVRTWLVLKLNKLVAF